MEDENPELKGKENEEVKLDTTFKKPVLIGKLGKIPRKVVVGVPSEVPTHPTETLQITNSESSDNSVPDIKNKEQLTVSIPNQQIKENLLPLPYTEPVWSGVPSSSGKDYILEVLKNGLIIETINLMSKAYWMFGRVASCDVCMQHPTISRFHAVLQYRIEPSETEASGFYLYDLGSTHGTFLNKSRLKPKVYARIQVGHMLKLGCSTRSYILTGPEDDEEAESELSITEMKQKREEELLRRKEEAARIEREMLEKKRREEERGVDWGLGEDADEETDLSENPFAQSNNEELYLDDPKKALRGFFDREGLDLEYDCTEQGMGQFLCKVELPVDDDQGRPVVAEMLHKGKKKEAVVQCALEACRILDRYGVLRQATHESRKRKVKNWEENDYYDSDDDTFLDRTGTIEKKREKRMNAKLPQKAETYESLLAKETIISTSISDLEKKLAAIRDSDLPSPNDNQEEDPLDSFMQKLNPDKQAIGKLKLDLAKLKSERAAVARLLNLAKPADIPNLAPGPSKRKKLMRPAKETAAVEVPKEAEEAEEREEEAVAEEEDRLGVEAAAGPPSSTEEVSAGDFGSTQNRSTVFKKFETILKQGLPPFANYDRAKLEQLLTSLKRVATDEDRLQVDWKMLAAKKRKVAKLMADLGRPGADEKLERRVATELGLVLAGLDDLEEEKGRVVEQVRTISEAIDSDCRPGLEEEEEEGGGKRRKNKRRAEQKAEQGRRRGYEEDASKEDYSMWVPPSGQSGDGRTSLNDKYGY